MNFVSFLPLDYTYFDFLYCAGGAVFPLMVPFLGITRRDLKQTDTSFLTPLSVEVRIS